MIILGIDTSCDDTAIAIVKVRGRKKPRFKILSNIVSSQVKIHQKYGGVYPRLAKREHQKNLPIVLKKALNQANTSRPEKEIDLIAVTNGPGLEPCLWQGINFSQEISAKWKKQIVPVNHIEAHIFANYLPKGTVLGQSLKGQALFPAVCLVVSGGHTQLILMNPVRKSLISNGVKSFGKYKILGETRDDAAGECFDKTARILGLDYPGGPAIATKAAQIKVHYGGPTPVITKVQNYRGSTPANLPRPMIYSKDYDFSFSGLKTAVLYDYKKRNPKIRKSRAYIRAMAKEIQQAIIDVLILKTIKAAKEYRAKSIILGGGVAANEELRRQLKAKIKKEIPNTYYLIPDTSLCTDNAAMVAVAGHYNYLENKSKNWRDISAKANLRIT